MPQLTTQQRQALEAQRFGKVSTKPAPTTLAQSLETYRFSGGGTKTTEPVTELETPIETIPQDVLNMLNSYKSGEGYRLVDILQDDALSVDQLLDAGFEQSDIDNAQQYISYLDILSKYKSGEGYNLTDVISNNALTEQQLLSMGFSQEDIDKAKFALNPTITDYKGRTIYLNDYKTDTGYDLVRLLYEHNTLGVSDITALGFSSEDYFDARRFLRKYEQLPSGEWGTQNTYELSSGTYTVTKIYGTDYTTIEADDHVSVIVHNPDGSTTITRDYTSGVLAGKTTSTTIPADITKDITATSPTQAEADIAKDQVGSTLAVLDTIYKEGDSYDVTRALYDGSLTTEQLIQAGIDKEVIVQQAEFAKDNVRLNTGDWLPKDVWDSLSDKEQKAYMEWGSKVQYIPMTEKEVKESTTLTEQGKASLLKGIKEGYIIPAEAGTEVYYPEGIAEAFWWGMTPWKEEYGETVGSYGVAKGVGVMSAEIVVPGVYLARHWGELDNVNKGLLVALDVLTVALPVVSLLGRTGKTTTGIITRVQTAGSNDTKLLLNAAADVNEAQSALARALKALPAEVYSPSGALTRSSEILRASNLANKLRIADSRFVNMMKNIGGLTGKELSQLERLTGFKGLKDAVVDLAKVQGKLDKAWVKYDASTLSRSSPEYVKLLQNINKWSAKRVEALKRLNSVVGSSYGQKRIGIINKVADTLSYENIKKFEKELAFAFKDERGSYRFVTREVKMFDNNGRTVIRRLPVKETVKTSATVTTKTRPKVYWEWLKPEKPKPKAKAKVREVTPSQHMPSISRALEEAYRGIEKAKFDRALKIYKDTGRWSRLDKAIRDAFKNAGRLSGIALANKILYTIQLQGLTVTNKQATEVLAKAQAVTESATMVAVATMSNASTKTATETKLADAIAELTKTVTDVTLDTSTETQTQLKTNLKLATSVVTDTTATIVTTPYVPAVKPIVPHSPFRVIKPPIRGIPKILLPSKKRLDELTPQERKGAIAWRQGELHGKGVWIVVYPPYKNENKIYHIGKPPFGIKRITGKGSAYKTAEILKGKLKEPLDIKIGFMRLHVPASTTGKVGRKLKYYREDTSEVSSSRRK